MPIELIKNPMKVCRIIGENLFSTVVEEDINVPDVNPDVYRILSSKAAVMIKDCEVLNDKVLVNGQVITNILYSADVDGKPMNSMDVSANFSQSIEIAGARPKMKEDINAIIQHVDCHVINSRKVNIKVIMDLFCRLEELYDLELATDVRGLGDIQVLREPYSFKQVAGYNRDQYSIREEIELQGDKPSIERIIKSDFRISIKDDKISDGKVEVSGVVGVNALYLTRDEDNPIVAAEFDIPFTQYIEIPAAERSMQCVTDVSLKEGTLEFSDDMSGEPRVLNVDCTMNLSAKVYRDAEEDIVVDAYSPSNVLDISRDIYRINELVGAARANTVIKESISIKHGDPEIERVCSVDITPVINEVKLLDDRVVIEGTLECRAVYMSSYSAEPMCSLEEQIPFRHFVDIPGTRLGMQNAAKCYVDSVSYSLINSEMVEVRVVLGASAEIMRPIEKKMVSRIEQVEGVALDHNRIPAVTIYLVQRGDTLWSIAKRYNTTVDALVKLNNIENPSKLQVGMQIMILKNVRAGQTGVK